MEKKAMPDVRQNRSEHREFSAQVNSTQDFCWAFIGAGVIARSAADAIRKAGGHRVGTVYSRTQKRAEKLAKKSGARVCQSLEQAVCDPAVQGVYIATTAESHYAITKQCLELGKPVLLEKPFTMTAAQAGELFALAKEKSLYLAEAMWSWFSPVARASKHWLDAGEAGDIRHVKLTYSSPVKIFFPRLLNPAKAGGALLDCGVYPLTFAYCLFGKPQSVHCAGVVKGGVDRGENVTMTFSSGLCVTVVISIEGKFDEELIIEGTRGKIQTKMYHAAKKTTLTRADGTVEVFEGDGGLANEFSLVASEIREGRLESAYVPAQTTLEVMAIMDECRRQMGLVYPFER